MAPAGACPIPRERRGAVGCAEVPFAKGDFAYLRDTTKQANAAPRRQATAEGVRAVYADTCTATLGHGMCRSREE
ncbi:hypothetical protein [Streptomyces sp. NBC_00343]|uniref:hypothetical protein n=1 Tax=Streptomyces sp. NBC_00343 TaxID=2975719 RepID=UPI002E27C2A0|nr:hypothetical protein [Streptomyces sp. NBC_00343]